MSDVKVIQSPLSGAFLLVMSTITSMIGYHIHGSMFWAIMDFFFWGFAWIKWLCFQEVSMRIIRETFSFFFN